MIAHRLLCAGFAFLIWPVWAQEATDANLITAIDVSGSVKDAEEHLELEGMAAALVDPSFLEAIARGSHGRIGFAAFTWADGQFPPLVPWSLIGSKADAEQVAARLRNARGDPTMVYATRLSSRWRPWWVGNRTDVSAAIDHAIEISAGAPFESRHNVINVCANGTDNVGDGPEAARDRADAKGLIVNGPVLGHRADAEEVAHYFREHVQVGAGSFVIVARRFEDIASAMLAKFLVELTAVAPSPLARQPLLAPEAPS